MVKVVSIESGTAERITGKIGKAFRFGRRRFGYVKYGEEERVVGPAQYGKKYYGNTLYGNAHSKWGIFQMMDGEPIYDKDGNFIRNKRVNVKKCFYIPSNPQTVDQQANRNTFADAVEKWQGLTEDEKALYNIKAEGKQVSGYNLFISEYMLSN